MNQLVWSITEQIVNERRRQERLKEEGKFPWTLAAVGPSPEAKLAVLSEEFGEVAREVSEHLTGKRLASVRLRTELIQIAAVCVAWVEALDTEAAYAPQEPQVGLFTFEPGTRVYHRRADLFGRVERCYGTAATVKYEYPWDQSLPPESVPVSELEKVA
jgi:NTP pyrophosphatase (non-canonical NTP hydrolase)